MFTSIMKELGGLVRAVLFGGMAAAGAYLGTLALMGVLDLCCTDGALRAMIELPQTFLEALQCKT